MIDLRGELEGTGCTGGYGYGYCFGAGDGFGEGKTYKEGDGYGCGSLEGEGYGCGFGDGYGDGNDWGSGEGSGEGEKIGTFGFVDVALLYPWPYVKIGWDTYPLESCRKDLRQQSMIAHRYRGDRDLLEALLDEAVQLLNDLE